MTLISSNRFYFTHVKTFPTQKPKQLGVYVSHTLLPPINSLGWNLTFNYILNLWKLCFSSPPGKLEGRPFDVSGNFSVSHMFFPDPTLCHSQTLQAGFQCELFIPCPPYLWKVPGNIRCHSSKWTWVVWIPTPTRYCVMQVWI